MKKIIVALFLLYVFTFNASSQGRNFKEPYEIHAENMYVDAVARYSIDKIPETGLQRWQSAFRKELKEKLGVSVIERQLENFRPSAEMTLREDVDYAIREWWNIRTEPDVVIPCVILKPKGAEGQKYPLMITPHGHSKSTVISAGIYKNNDEREKGETGERNVAVQAVKHGFIAIAQTARGFGDTRLPKDIEEDKVSSCYDLYLKDALVGRTPVGDRVWDVMKIIDWALAELPVDGKNILISGNSGGGTVSLYAGAVDTRISMSLPASSYADFSMSIGHRRHCSCNYIPGIMQLGDMGEIAGLIAPRCFCAIQGEEDDLFPIDGAKKAFETTRKIYEMAGAADNCNLYVGKGGHRYYKDGAWEFIGKHMPASADDAETKIESWKNGMLDIHIISTGCGNCSFFVLPDGTTMLMDAGDLRRPDARASGIRPNPGKTAGKWIEEYIKDAVPGIETIDYALVTHYHDDHIGCEENAVDKHPQGGYALSGITEIGSNLKFAKLIDRGYEFPSEPDSSIDFYRQFVKWNCKNKGMIHEIARLGSNSQISLINNPEEFRNFKIRILFSAGQIAEKQGEKIEKAVFKKGDNPGENALSTGIRLDYGKFSFYSGGDIAGISHTGGLLDDSMESLVADIVGEVDVAVMNHHGNRDTQNEKFVSALSPRVWIGQCWGTRHPGEEVVRRISSKYIYPGDRDIYATYMAPSAKEFLGKYTGNYKSTEGHILIRVEEGGEKYNIYVLDDSNCMKKVIYHEKYEVKKLNLKD